MRCMAAHFSGDICLALDRPIDGVEKLVAPAASVAVTTGFEAAFHRGLTQTPPPIFSFQPIFPISTLNSVP